MTVPATEAQAAPVEEKKTTPAESFQQMRKMLEQERSEKEKLRQEKIALEKEVSRSKSVPQGDDEDGDEPYVDPRTLKRKLAKLEESIDQKIEKKAEEKARVLMEEEKRQGYLKQNDDFQKIMAPELIQKFAEKHPRVAEAILQMPDSFERQKLVYENIKALGIHKPEEDKSVQKKIDENRRGPFYQPSGTATAPYNGMGDFSASGQKSAYAKMQELKSRLRI